MKTTTDRARSGARRNEDVHGTPTPDRDGSPLLARLKAWLLRPCPWTRGDVLLLVWTAVWLAIALHQLIGRGPAR